jgi:hypothetical protein
MLSVIKKSLTEKHPAIVEFMCQAVEKKLYPDLDTDDEMLVRRTVHHTYILNELVKRMSADQNFMLAIISHLKNKRKEFGIRSNLFQKAMDVHRIAGEWFSPAKTLTMDLGLDIIMKTRTEKNPSMPIGQNIKNDPTGLILNILEASASDFVRGFMANSRAGIALAINPVQIYSLDPRNNNIRWHMDQDWASLYETWNLAFITGNLGNLNLLYPKLMIPEVLDAAPDDYLIQRIEALWLSINFTLFAQADRGANDSSNNSAEQKPKISKRNILMPNRDKLAELWGAINLKYAKKYVNKRNNKDLEKLSDMISVPLQKSIEGIMAKLKTLIPSQTNKE